MTEKPPPNRPGARNLSRKTEILRLAGAKIKLPSDIRFTSPQERDYYQALLHYRAPDDWSEGDLRRLKAASEAWWNAEVESDAIAAEDTVLVDEKGAVRMNPRVRVRDMALRLHNATLRGLAIGRPPGDARTLAKRRDDIEAARRMALAHPLLTAVRGVPLTVIEGGRAARKRKPRQKREP